MWLTLGGKSKKVSYKRTCVWRLVEDFAESFKTHLRGEKIFPLFFFLPKGFSLLKRSSLIRGRRKKKSSNHSQKIIFSFIGWEKTLDRWRIYNCDFVLVGEKNNFVRWLCSVQISDGDVTLSMTSAESQHEFKLCFTLLIVTLKHWISKSLINVYR